MKIKYDLDVGCKEKPKGKINVDIVDYSETVKNFVLANGENLPFESNSFWSVYSSHAIEHTNNPSKFLSELIRVSKQYVILKCPYFYAESLKKLNDVVFRVSNSAVITGEHKYMFRKKWFLREFKKYNITYIMKLRGTYPFLLFFAIPKEIVIQIRKNITWIHV